MMGKEFDAGWYDDESTTDPFRLPNCHDELGSWVEDNQSLWDLGIKLATSAMYYQQECAHFPFYKNGLFSPN